MEGDTETESLSNHLLDTVYFSPKRLSTATSTAPSNGKKADSEADPSLHPPSLTSPVEPPIYHELRRSLQVLLPLPTSEEGGCLRLEPREGVLLHRSDSGRLESIPSVLDRHQSLANLRGGLQKATFT